MDTQDQIMREIRSGTFTNSELNDMARAIQFARVLNIEKKMQNIRDDILEMNGLNPSWTRQYSNSAQPSQIATTSGEE